MPSYRIICDVEREDLRAAIDLTEQLVEHGYVEFARVEDDGDGTYVPEPDLLDIGDKQHIKLSNLDGEEAIRFLYERAKILGYGEGEAAARRSTTLYQAKQNHALVEDMLRTACAGDQEIRYVIGRAARRLLQITPMVGSQIDGMLSRLNQCNLNDNSKMVPLGILEAVLTMAVAANKELSEL